MGSAVCIDLTTALPWVVKRRAQKPDAARLTVAAEQAERLRIANARTRRELITVAEAQLIVHEACAYIVQACEAMPQRVSSDEHEQAKVRDECRALREGFAKCLEALATDEANREVGGGDRPSATH